MNFNFSNLKKYFTAYNKKLPAPTVRKVQTRALAEERNASTYSANIGGELERLVHPGATTRKLQLKPLTIDVLDRSVSSIIADFIASNPDLAFAYRSYQDFTISKFKVDGKSDKSRRRAEGFIEDMERGREDFLSFLKRDVYMCYVEGGSSIRLRWSADGKTPVRLEVVSPFKLEGRILQDAQGNENQRIYEYRQNLLRPVLIQDDRNPNPFYRYAPINVTGTEMFGNSSIEPALWGMMGKVQLMSLLLGFTRGQILPRGLLSPDLATILASSPNAALTASDILAFGNEVADALEDILDGSDVTQDFISSFPVLYEVIGAVKDANFEPISILSENFATIIQIGARLPSIIYQPANLRGNLGDRKADIDWGTFDARCVSINNLVSREVSTLIDIALLGDRSSDAMYEPGVSVVIERDDAEIKRIRSEALLKLVTAYLAVKQLHVFDRSELRRIVVEGRLDFSGFSVELPTSLKNVLDTEQDKTQLSQTPIDTQIDLSKFPPESIELMRLLTGNEFATNGDP